MIGHTDDLTNHAIRTHNALPYNNAVGASCINRHSLVVRFGRAPDNACNRAGKAIFLRNVQKPLKALGFLPILFRISQLTTQALIFLAQFRQRCIRCRCVRNGVCRIGARKLQMRACLRKRLHNRANCALHLVKNTFLPFADVAKRHANTKHEHDGKKDPRVLRSFFHLIGLKHNVCLKRFRVIWSA